VSGLVLGGCRAETLAGYLAALGLLRVVVRQADPAAQLHWKRDTAVLTTSLTSQELAAWLVNDYEPSPIVSPWNAGSGFAGNGKSPAAERALEAFRSTGDQRFASLRVVIEAADRVVAIARSRGWEGGPLWAEDRKKDVVRLCRNMLPDDALPWLDVAVTLTTDDLRFSPLTGTGGNFGRQDLSATFLQRLALVAGPDAKRAQSLAWAEAALFGHEDVPYVRDTVGQYDPGRAGGILSTPGEKTDDTGFANPWGLILTLEGTLLFASAVTRRNQASSGAGSLPFLTRASAVGYDSAALAEAVKGEQWIPLWPRPAGLAEIEHLMGEGRAQWNGRPARTGLEFALAVASLGVDRGLSAFRRYVIAPRLGQNPLAVSVDRLPVRHQAAVALLREPYVWIQRLSRITLPAGVATAVRRTEQAIYDAASGGGAAALQKFVIEFGRLHAAVSRSGTVRDQISPYQARRPGDWLAVLPPDDELWVAAGFASLRDDPRQRGADRSPRGLLTRVQEHGRTNGRLETVWVDRSPTGLDLNGVTLARALAHAQRLLAIPTDSPDRPNGQDTEPDATAGTAYTNGQMLPVRLVEAYALGLLDDHLIADYLGGLLALGCRPTTTARWEQVIKRPTHPALAALLPFFSTDLLQVRPINGTEQDPPQSTGVRLTPRPEWISRLMASGMSTIAPDVLRRLAIAGCQPVLDADALARMPVDGIRLAGALLLRVPARARVRALTAVSAVIPAPTKEAEGVPS
jgi:CRISPR-associated protein Csx17